MIQERSARGGADKEDKDKEDDSETTMILGEFHDEDRDGDWEEGEEETPVSPSASSSED